MIKVLRVGDSRRTQNPADGQWQDITPVTYMETGRGTSNELLSQSTDFLSRAVGEEIGLPGVRIHTHPVLTTHAGRFRVGTEFPNLFINRHLFSLPQLPGQVGTDPRMVDGKPTFFVTSVSDRKAPDDDQRMSNEALAKIMPEYFKQARVGTAEVVSADGGPVIPFQGVGNQGAQAGGQGNRRVATTPPGATVGAPGQP